MKQINKPNFYQFRVIQPGEFMVVAGDCAQGGLDKNYCQFFSKTKLDIPLVYRASGVAAEMTNAIFPVLEFLSDLTGMRPVVAFERQQGGASEMQRLEALNRMKKYKVFVMPKIGEAKSDDTLKLGWDTTLLTRPIMLGDWYAAYKERIIKIYDEETIKQHRTFIINERTGKPEAARSMHDDAVMSCAIGWQLFNRCKEDKMSLLQGLQLQTEVPNPDPYVKRVMPVVPQAIQQDIRSAPYE